MITKSRSTSRAVSAPVLPLAAPRPSRCAVPHCNKVRAIDANQESFLPRVVLFFHWLLHGHCIFDPCVRRDHHFTPFSPSSFLFPNLIWLSQDCGSCTS